MRQKVNWIQILVECKESIRRQVAPILKTLSYPQPDLGIGAGGDPIKEADMAAENAIVDVLRKHKISFTLVSEESGVKEYGRAPTDCFVTADPIDGTTNLMRGVPFYASSIAISTEAKLSRIRAGLVTDLFHGATYTAQKGKGAYRDGAKIMPSSNVLLEEAVIGIDLNSYKVDKIVPLLNELIKRTNHIRHFGANALELCYVADGTTDAFIDIRGKLRTTDVAAASLILREAGGIITMPDGKALDAKLDPRQKVEFIAAANHEIHRIILDLINSRKEET